MISIPKGSTVGPSNPLVVFYSQQNGRLVDLASLEFQVFDLTKTANAISPARVVPVLPGPPDREAVDVNANRIGLGRYAPTFTLPSVAGLYRIVWFWKFDASGAEFTATQDFEAIDGSVASADGYALVSDLKAECVEATSDVQIQVAIKIASRLIDSITGRSFGARYATHNFDGRESRALLLWEPVIAVESIRFEEDTPVDLDVVRVYNRHLSGLIAPDDRNDPKIEFEHGRDLLGAYSEVSLYGIRRPGVQSRIGLGIFPFGVQNVEVVGVFGYTEADGSPWGKVPDLIRHATKLIAVRELPTLGESACRSATRDGWRIVEEKTRDQSVKYANPRKFGQWIGDADIDSILSMFLRPPMLGSV